MTNTSTTAGTGSAEKIREALDILSEAAREKKEEIRLLVADRYSHLKEALGGTTTSLSETLTERGHRAAEAAREAKDLSLERMQHVSRVVDENVHRNPWTFIGGVALASLLLGYVLGRNRD